MNYFLFYEFVIILTFLFEDIEAKGGGIDNELVHFMEAELDFPETKYLYILQMLHMPKNR